MIEQEQEGKAKIKLRPKHQRNNKRRPERGNRRTRPKGSQRQTKRETGGPKDRVTTRSTAGDQSVRSAGGGRYGRNPKARRSADLEARNPHNRHAGYGSWARPRCSRASFHGGVRTASQIRRRSGWDRTPTARHGGSA